MPFIVFAWGIVMVGRHPKSVPVFKSYDLNLMRHFMASLVTMEICLVRLYLLILTVPVDEDIGLRFLLGMTEAGLSPGIIFYLSW